MVGVVSDLWRYPVASMSGERLRRAFIGPLGLVGDRQCAVVDATTGKPLVAVREPALLRYRARCDDPGTGIRMVRPLSAMARATAWRIHHVA